MHFAACKRELNGGVGVRTFVLSNKESSLSGQKGAGSRTEVTTQDNFKPVR